MVLRSKSNTFSEQYSPFTSKKHTFVECHGKKRFYDTMEIKRKTFIFILYFARFAVTLHTKQ